jgi:hypothetical protein
MGDAFIGSEAISARVLTPYQLRSQFTRVHPDVYRPRGSEPTAATRAEAAWLWSGREGVIPGQSAAALHGAKWVDANRPAGCSGLTGDRRAGYMRGRTGSKRTR